MMPPRLPAREIVRRGPGHLNFMEMKLPQSTRPIWVIRKDEGGEEARDLFLAGVAAVPWPEVGDLTDRLNSNDRKWLNDEFANAYPNKTPAAASFWAGQLWSFIREVEPGDLIFFTDHMANPKEVHAGYVTGPYIYDSTSKRYPNQRNVTWFAKKPRDTLAKELLKELGENGNFYRVNNRERELRAAFQPSGSPTPAPAVPEVADRNDIERLFGRYEMIPLNQILYGPPGTGKTYTSIERAVEIIDGHNYDGDHKACKERFDELRAAGRIGFVTFHQSFGYEEFVEGIRPVMDDATEVGATYKVATGPLKLMAFRALGACLKRNESQRVGFDQLWQALLDKIETQPDWQIDGLTKNSKYRFLPTDDRNYVEAVNTASQKAPQPEYKSRRELIEKAWNFIPRDQKPSSPEVYRATGVGSPNGFISAVIMALRELPLAKTAPSKGTSTVPEAPDEAAKSYLNGSKDWTYKRGGARHVLIIDEINRGNISRILGELITLLEEDKRIGADNDLRVTLPYSGDSFALPGNLYVLGTMNTADKSLAMLDVALRRRFSFTEMPPQLNQDTCPGMTAEMLAVVKELNRRLTLIRDREHRIGHAYFHNVASVDGFNHVLREKIFPLLMEFFYNDWDGLREVLGESGNGGTLIVSLDSQGLSRARNKWAWWFDQDGVKDPDALAVLTKNYGIIPTVITEALAHTAEPNEAAGAATTP